MEIKLQLGKEQVTRLCQSFRVKKDEIENVLMTFCSDDTESQYYRDLSFDIDKFLLSKEIGELIIMRSEAISKQVKYNEERK